MCIRHALHTRGLNPQLTTNGFSHHYQLDESTFIFRDFSDFYCLSQFLMNFLLANRIAPPAVILFAYVKRYARLKGVEQIKITRLK